MSLALKTADIPSAEKTAQLMVLIDAADRGFLNDTTRAAPLGDTSLDLSQQFFLLPLGLKS